MSTSLPCQAHDQEPLIREAAGTTHRRRRSRAGRWLLHVFVIAAGVLFQQSEAAAQPVSCSAAIRTYLDSTSPSVHALAVAGTHLTARGYSGYTAFTMADSFVASHFGTPTAEALQTFMIGRDNANTQYTGAFALAFPGRPDGAVESMELSAGRDGTIRMRGVGGDWSPLQGVSCFRGPEDQVVVRGHFYFDSTYWGTEFWMLVLSPVVLF